jgi:raffinose/stachyose/melibiose transport system permease protein
VTKRRITGILFVAPAALVYLPLVLIPVLYSVGLSFFSWDGLRPMQWYGLGNYSALISDDVVHRAVLNNCLLVAISLFIQLPLAMAFAVALAGSKRLLGVIRACMFVPYLLPTVVIALVWKLLFTAIDPELLGSTTTSLPAIMVVICWRFIGFHMVLYLAGIAQIEPDLYAAARLDGANNWQCFHRITLPLLQPVIRVSAVLAVVGSMKFFDIVYIMTGGGPAHATELLATHIYSSGIESQLLGYASALGVLLMAIPFFGLLIGRTVLRRLTKEAAAS